MNDDDVRVSKPRNRTRFSNEPLAQFGIVLKIVFQQLDRDESIEAGVAGEIQSTHAANPEATLNLISADVTEVTARHV